MGSSARSGPTISIRGRTVGGGAPVLVVAEIGTSHGGSLTTARSLIEAAADAGADCAKFQAVFADEIIHPNAGTVPLPGGEIALFERFRSLERDPSFYASLKELTEGAGLLFLCTPFGSRSAGLLEKLDVAAYKIASPELNHFPLLRQVAGYRKPLLLSSGVSLLADIEKALALTGRDVALLHCVTSYPAPETDYNLRLLPSLRSLFGVPVGVSDHSPDPALVPGLCAALGGAVVEKHICLSRQAGGLDDPIALPPAEFRAMVEAIRLAEASGAEETVERFSRLHGAERVQAVLGSGIKELAGSERESYARTNRSVHALSPIPAGATFSEENVALLRTEKRLRPGLPPEMLQVVLGRRAARDVPSGEGLRWEDLLGD